MIGISVLSSLTILYKKRNSFRFSSLNKKNKKVFNILVFTIVTIKITMKTKKYANFLISLYKRLIFNFDKITYLIKYHNLRFEIS